jgi:hypothetical protein
VLVLAARRFDFADDAGKQVVGMNVTFLVQETRWEPDGGGMEPIKMSGPVEMFDQVSAVPGLYDLDVSTRLGRGGKAAAVLGGLRFVGAVDVAEFFEVAA